MAEIKTPSGPNIVAVYADHEQAESAIRRLHKDGFALDELSIVGRNIQVTEEPRGFVSTGDYVSAGARTGAAAGGLAGIALGAALLLVPGIGPVVVAGPLAAALLAGHRGRGRRCCAGCSQRSVDRPGRSQRTRHQVRNRRAGRQVPRPRARCDGDVERARRVLAAEAPEQIGVHDTLPAD